MYQYGYNPAGWTSAITTTVQGSATTQTLTHDALSRLTAASGASSTGSWSYDGRGNLTSATSNGATTSYSYMASNPEEVASTTVGSGPATNYSYDGNGDTTSITNTSTLNRQLSYDAQGRLTQVTLGSPITETVTMAYNAFGQRAGYTVTPAGQSASLVESFKYQGDQLAQVASSGSSITTPYTDTYVYQQDGAPLELLRQLSGASTATPYWYVLDGQGNVVALVDQAGSVVDSYSYDQWGKLTSSSESVPQRLRYAGYWYDQELGWYWLTVRAYDPVLERFLQPDPSEMEGLFTYVYAGDEPSGLADPSGLKSHAASLANPPQDGPLVTGNGNPESNVQAGSTQYNLETSGSSKPYSGGKGANRMKGLPPQCSGPIVMVCSVGLQAYRLSGDFTDLCKWHIGPWNVCGQEQLAEQRVTSGVSTVNGWLFCATIRCPSASAIGAGIVAGVAFVVSVAAVSIFVLNGGLFDSGPEAGVSEEIVVSNVETSFIQETYFASAQTPAGEVFAHGYVSTPEYVPSLGYRNVLHIDIRTYREVNKTRIRVANFTGKQQFSAIARTFRGKFNVVLGNWQQDSDNLARFNELTENGMSLEQAAFGVWTGQQLAELGATNVVVETTGFPGAYTQVKAFFY